ncbi:MAG: hypothetical protein PHI90_10080 [Clostridia bacterium]|nr:hypothetical protein [Clostridia bacterium]
MLDLNHIITPETLIVIISPLSAFLIIFFGKIIADSTPFADDRKLLREIEGIIFFLLQVVSPAFGVILLLLIYSDLYNIVLAFNNHNLFQYLSQFCNDIFLQLILMAVIILVILSFWFVNKEVNDFVYKNKAITESKYYFLQKELLSFLTLVLMLFVAMLYYWGEYVYIVPILIFLFLHLLGIAIFLSLKSQNIGMVDVYFTEDSKKEPIIECRLLRINEDNIKIMKDSTCLLINKSQIFQIVEKIDVKKIGELEKRQSLSYSRYNKERIKLINSLLKKGYANFKRAYRRI